MKFDILMVVKTLKMEIVCFSETLEYAYEYTRCYNPEEQHRQKANYLSVLLVEKSTNCERSKSLLLDWNV
jgi:hypothetical protein